MRKFTFEQLEQYDGKKGRPAYIAYKGKVYDVSASGMWMDGEHFGLHQSGQDTTEEMADAPHGEEKLEAIELIGELVK